MSAGSILLSAGLQVCRSAGWMLLFTDPQVRYGGLQVCRSAGVSACKPAKIVLQACRLCRFCQTFVPTPAIEVGDLEFVLNEFDEHFNVFKTILITLGTFVMT